MGASLGILGALLGLHGAAVGAGWSYLRQRPVG
jgi:hypothetical protein